MKNKNFYNRNKYFLTAILFFILDFGLTWYFINFYPNAAEGNPLFNIDGGYIALALTLYIYC